MVQFHSFSCECPVFPAPFGEKTILSSSNDLGIQIKSQMTMYASKGLFMAFYSILLVYVYLYANMF